VLQVHNFNKNDGGLLTDYEKLTGRQNQSMISHDD